MASTDNFEIAFNKLEQEMERDAKLLDRNKEELKLISQESETFKSDIFRLKQEILTKEKILKTNDDRKRKLEPEIRKMEDDQRKDHMELQRIQQTNEARLKEHGVQIPKGHSL